MNVKMIGGIVMAPTMASTIRNIEKLSDVNYEKVMKRRASSAVK